MGGAGVGLSITPCINCGPVAPRSTDGTLYEWYCSLSGAISGNPSGAGTGRRTLPPPTAPVQWRPQSRSRCAAPLSAARYRQEHCSARRRSYPRNRLDVEAGHVIRPPDAKTRQATVGWEVEHDVEPLTSSVDRHTPQHCSGPSEAIDRQTGLPDTTASTMNERTEDMIVQLEIQSKSLLGDHFATSSCVCKVCDVSQVGAAVGWRS